jgi:uncharacterized membrane protein YdcZ (DUF606 family)
VTRNVHQFDIAGGRGDSVADVPLWATDGGGLGRKYHTVGVRRTAKVGGKTLAAHIVALQALSSSAGSLEDRHPAE